ncbi:DNA-directed RNA polymerase, mitochondrial isoform X2 [Ambystoma mexicanum]|uniref:DNA-directed RNA polymerase, mitochondrial isoform X2 n=1 Tax=Ambystoma mexicanum TaxID=8296 RepID=UPI0037E97D23
MGMAVLKLRRVCDLLRGIQHEKGCHLEAFKRRYSSANPKKESVLEVRMHQLQAKNALDLSRNNTTLAVSQGVLNVGHPQETTTQTTTKASEASNTESGLSSAPQPSRWMEKLDKDRWTKQKRQQRLQEQYWHFPVRQGVRKRSDEEVATTGPQKKLTKKSRVMETSVRSPSSKTVSSRSGSTKKGSTESQKLEKLANDAHLAAIEALEEQIRSSGTLSSSPPLNDKQSTTYGNTQLSILAFLEACIFIGALERAQEFLLYYHRFPARRKLLSIKMYDVLLHGWARKGSLQPIGRLFSMMEEAGLKPTLSSYAAALECMGRGNLSPRVIGRCLMQLTNDGLCLEDLLQDCAFQEDERELVLKAIHAVDPEFKPPLLLRKDACTSHLLKDFYCQGNPVSYPKLDFSVADLQERFQRQLALERASTVTIDSVEAVKPLTEQNCKARELLRVLRARWRKSLLRALQDSKIRMGALSDRSQRVNLYPFLCLLEDEEYVDIMMQSISNLPPSGDSLLVVARDLGTQIYNKYCISRKDRTHVVSKMDALYAGYSQLLAKETKVSNYLPREYWQKLESEFASGPSLVSDDSPWPHPLLVQLGAHLVDLMVSTVKVTNVSPEPKPIPVLYHMYTFRSHRQIGFIKPHPIFTQLLLDAAETTLTFDSYIMPMLCPPIPWTSPRFGTYILNPTKLMRSVEGAIQHQLRLEHCPPTDLYPVLDSLNQLGNCPWKINQPVLDIIISIFNQKGDEKLDIPPPISEAPKYCPLGDATPMDKPAMKREMAMCRKKAAEMYSLRMDALYKLSIANHMRDEIFWFPHNMDFRGRTYPCPPYLNHLGSDVTRAILLFAEGRELGQHGLNWLKTHLINLTGLKKKNSLQERLAYANEIMDNILDSADHPLTGRRWWMGVDEPWQALACCIEIAKAHRSLDPVKYISHFPVHQDGSCNGLQHYAALGRDAAGATSVNLMPCDTPQDVYSGVSQQVEEFRKRDAERGMKIAQVLEGYISRKVVKQTVMTVVYGVTRYGGRLQIEKRLREIDTFPQEYVWEASHYLVQQVFSGLKEMFSGTREIQLWLTESARLISKSGSTVEWITPLGLPIVQPYHRTKCTVLRGSIQAVNLQTNYDPSEKPDTVKQKNAFPPNFIHSLDSTHMMLTALHCYRKGLTFVSVHDCFWTHAVTVNIMNKVCREQFVNLHSQPILKELSSFLLRKYCANIPEDKRNKNLMEHRRMLELLSRVPKTGDFDLRKVKESTYFFS